MITPKVIKKYGLDQKSLKKYFTAEKRDKNTTKLVRLIADRIREGRQLNFDQYRPWAAVDMARDIPFAQTTPTLVRNLIEGCKTASDVLGALEGWGLSEKDLFTSHEKDGKTYKELNLQTFFNVLIPFVRAYVTIRLAKIYNDRNLTPLFEYPPREFTEEVRVYCKILEEVVETISIDMGYRSTLRDFISNALMYGTSLKFPMEPWMEYTQENDEGKTETVKQGIRYTCPHITRTYFDLTYPTASINSDTGVTYAGYWTVQKWGEVAMNPTLWNRGNVPHGTNWIDPTAAWYNYFKEVYPCKLEFPQPRATPGRMSDRENMAFLYTKSDYDSAFFSTYHFQKLVPADWGLGDYPHEIWMRFMIGGDDTVMHACVFPYTPVEYIGYDSDSGRGRNASMALEILPFQDMTANVFNQFIQTIKRNLTNFTFYDSDVIDKTQLETLRRNTSTQYSGANFVAVSGLNLKRANVPDIRSAFSQVGFPFQDTNQILSGVNTIISMLERVLAMSAQEIGAQASHQQSKKEIEVVEGSSTNRLSYTASFVDEGIDAWKRNLARAAIYYMDGTEVSVSIPHHDFPNIEKSLKMLGFDFISEPMAGQRKVGVTGKIEQNQMRLARLVAYRSDAVRGNDSTVATLMLQTIQTIANSQRLSSLVAPDSLIEWIERAAKLGGVDDDFKLKMDTNGALANQLKEIIQQIENEVVQPVAKEIGDIQKQNASNMQEVAQEMALLKQNMEKIEAALGMQPTGQPAPVAASPVMPPVAAPAQPAPMLPDPSMQIPQ